MIFSKCFPAAAFLPTFSAAGKSMNRELERKPKRRKKKIPLFLFTLALNGERKIPLLVLPLNKGRSLYSFKFKKSFKIN